jgi:hypothetical protein
MRTLYDGNLRFFGIEPSWRTAFEGSLVGLTLHAETAFGAMYCLDPSGRLHLLNPETRTLTETGCNEIELLDLIAVVRCRAAYGQIDHDQHYAFRVPLALGGTQDVVNVRPLDAGDHMRFLGVVSSQIAKMPPGTQFHPIGS